MYAVIRTGGKQYRVQEGDVLKIEMLKAEEGDNVTFEEVLLAGEGKDVKIGAPLLEGASVEAKVTQIGRHEKIRIVKFRRRKHSRKQQGHRQWFTEVEITGIKA